MKYNAEKAQKMMEQKRKEMEEENRMRQRDAVRQKYFEDAKKQIEDFKQQREETENLLMFAASHGHIPALASFMSQRQFSKAQFKQYNHNIEQTLMNRQMPAVLNQPSQSNFQSQSLLIKDHQHLNEQNSGQALMKQHDASGNV